MLCCVLTDDVSSAVTGVVMKTCLVFVTGAVTGVVNDVMAGVVTDAVAGVVTSIVKVL